MDRVYRIDRVTPLETASISLGLGFFLIWFSQVPSQALLPVAPILVPSFLFVFAMCCALLTRTHLPGAGSFAHTIWIAPCLLLLLPEFGSLWGPLKIPALLLPAFAASLMFCRWMTLCARFSPRLFLIFYCLSSLVAMAGTPLTIRTDSLRPLLPFFSTGLFLLSVRVRGWMPEGEHYTGAAPSYREGVGILVFALLLNGIQIIAQSHLPPTGLASFKALEKLSLILSLGVLAVLIRLGKPLSYHSLLAWALGFWVFGIPLSGISARSALFLLSMGCTFFELSFWLLMLQFSAQSPNPARMVCIGASLISFALLASQTLLDLLTPIGMRTLSLQSGFTLFIGLVSALFIFLPRAVVDIPKPASAAAPDPAAPTPDIPTETSSPDRKLRLKGCFESLGLTRQESRIAMMILDGADDAVLCGALFISKNTLKFHIRNINRKLGIATRRELPSLAERLVASGRNEVAQISTWTL